MASQAVLELLIELKDQASSGLDAIGGTLKTLGGVALGVAVTGIAAVGTALVVGMGDAREHAQVMAQTTQTIESMGNVAGVSAEHVESFAASLSAASGKSLFGDDQIQAATNMLLTFGNIKGETLDLATALTVDMAQALKKTPNDMSVMVGKLLNSADAMSAAQRMGVSFSDEQLKLGKHLFETGQIAEYQTLVLNELNKEFGGQAEAAARADGGWAQFQDRLGEAAESVATLFLPALNTLLGLLNSEVAPAIEATVGRVGDLVAAFQTGAEGGDYFGGLLNALYSLEDVSPIFATIADGLLSLSNGTSVLQPAIDILRGLVETLIDAGPVSLEFAEAIGQISPILGGIVQVAAEVLPNLSALIQQVFGDILAYVTEHGAEMVAQAQTTWASIQTTITGIAGPLADVINAVLAQISAFWQAHGDEILGFVGATWTQINGIIQSAMQLAQATIIPALQAIAGFINAHGTEIQLVLTAAWQVIQTIISGVLATIQGVINATLAAVRGDWAGAWEEIKGVAETQVNMALGIITGVLNMIAGIFGTTLTDISTNVSTKFSEYVTTVQGKIGEIVGVIEGLPAQVAGVGQAVVDMISSGFQTAWDGFMAGVREKLQGLRDMLPFSEPKDTSSPLYGLSKSGAAILDMIAGGMQANGDALTSGISPLLDTVNHELTAALTGVGADVYDTTDSFRELLQQLGMTWEQTNQVDTALQNLGKAYQEVGPGSMEVGEALDALGAALGLTKEQTLQLGFEFNKMVADAGNSASALSRTGDQVESSWAGAIEQITGQLDDSDLPDAAADLGDQIMAGWAEGMDDAFDGLLDQVNEMSEKLQREMEDAWDIASPSRWTHGLGNNILVGLIGGLEDTMPEVLATVQRLTGDLQAQIGAIGEQLKGKLTDEARAALEAERDAIQEQIDAINEALVDLPDQVHNAIADAFDASASIDRQAARNIDAINRLTEGMRETVTAQLSDALAEAQKITDPEQAAAFYQMRSRQILELAKLEQDAQAAAAAGNDQKAADLQQQIELIKAAQQAEQDAFDERQQVTSSGNLADLAAQISSILDALPDAGDNPLWQQLYNMLLQISAASTGAAIPGTPGTGAPLPPSTPAPTPPASGGPAPVLPAPPPMEFAPGSVQITIMNASEEEIRRGARQFMEEVDRLRKDRF